MLRRFGGTRALQHLLERLIDLPCLPDLGMRRIGGRIEVRGRCDLDGLDDLLEPPLCTRRYCAPALRMIEELSAVVLTVYLPHRSVQACHLDPGAPRHTR
jgi:hypothetical protein